MENDAHNIDRLIEERFAALRADREWRPDAGRGLASLREQRAARSSRRQRRALIGGIAAGVCIPLAAFPATRAFAARCVSACVAETSSVREILLGSASVSASSTWIQPQNRKMAPDFTLDDAAGQPVTLSSLHGKVVLLNFWATWCTPCAREIPWFVEFQQSLRDRGFEVLGISMDADGWRAVEPFVRAAKINYRVAIGNDKTAQLFGGLQAIPLTLVIDRSGRIAAIHSGLCKKTEYEADINSALDEK